MVLSSTKMKKMLCEILHDLKPLDFILLALTVVRDNTDFFNSPSSEKMVHGIITHAISEEHAGEVKSSNVIEHNLLEKRRLAKLTAFKTLESIMNSILESTGQCPLFKRLYPQSFEQLNLDDLFEEVRGMYFTNVDDFQRDFRQVINVWAQGDLKIAKYGEELIAQCDHLLSFHAHMLKDEFFGDVL